jgi:hypothetical protein
MNIKSVGLAVFALAGSLFATSASASTFLIDVAAVTGNITGEITVVGDNVTAFSGTASGFGYGGHF